MDNLLVIFGVPLAFLIFQLIAPYKPPKGSDLLIIEQNTKKYARLEKLAIFWILLSVGLICFMVYFFGFQLTKLLFPLEYNYIITPTGSYWFFPGLVLGFGLIRIPMEFIYKLILKQEYYHYTQFTNSRHGYDGEKIWRPFEWILTIAGIIIFIAGLNWFARIDQDNNIEFNELLEIKTHSYKLDNIVEISHIDNYYMDKGKRKKNNFYLIRMNDNYSWTSETYNFFGIQKDIESINKSMKVLSEKTGLTIK